MAITPGENHEARPRRSQRERREASRAAILAAAREEFLDREFGSVTLEDIADRAGLTRGAVYHQFKDKLDVFTAVVIAEAVRVREIIGASMRAVDHPIERLWVGCGLYLDMITDVRIMRMIHVDYPAACGVDRWTLESPWLNDVEVMLREAVERGLLREMPVRALARLVLAFIRESIVAFVFATDRRAVRDEMMSALEVLLRRLAPWGEEAGGPAASRTAR